MDCECTVYFFPFCSCCNVKLPRLALLCRSAKSIISIIYHDRASNASRYLHIPVTSCIFTLVLTRYCPFQAAGRPLTATVSIHVFHLQVIRYSILRSDPVYLKLSTCLLSPSDDIGSPSLAIH